MKFLLALAFLTVVCAIPRPGQITANNEGLVQSAPTQGSRQRNNQVGEADGAPRSELLLSSNKSDPKLIEDDDEDDSSEKVSLEDLIDALQSMRKAIQNKIHNKLSHHRVARVPDNDQSASKSATNASEHNKNDKALGNNTAVPNNTKINYSTIYHIPKMNITEIKKEILDKINNMIENALRPWLINNSTETVRPPQNGSIVDSGNILNNSGPSSGNSSKPEINGNANNTATDVPKRENSSKHEPQNGFDRNNITDVPQKTNKTELPSNGIALNESDEDSNHLAVVNSNSENDNEADIDDENSNTVPVELVDSEAAQIVQENVPEPIVEDSEEASESSMLAL